MSARRHQCRERPSFAAAIAKLILQTGKRDLHDRNLRCERCKKTLTKEKYRGDNTGAWQPIELCSEIFCKKLKIKEIEESDNSAVLVLGLNEKIAGITINKPAKKATPVSTSATIFQKRGCYYSLLHVGTIGNQNPILAKRQGKERWLRAPLSTVGVSFDVRIR